MAKANEEQKSREPENTKKKNLYSTRANLVGNPKETQQNAPEIVQKPDLAEALGAMEGEPEGDSMSLEFLDELTKKKKPTRILKGYYLDEDIAKVIDKLGKAQGKGGNSEVVNAILRNVLTSKGLLKK